MPKKGEHIYKRKDGRWEGRYRDGTYRNGKAIYRSIYGQNYYEVKKRLAICEEVKAAIKSPSKKPPLFKDAVILWQKTNVGRYKGRNSTEITIPDKQSYSSDSRRIQTFRA